MDEALGDISGEDSERRGASLKGGVEEVKGRWIESVPYGWNLPSLDGVHVHS